MHAASPEIRVAQRAHGPAGDAERDTGKDSHKRSHCEVTLAPAAPHSAKLHEKVN